MDFYDRFGYDRPLYTLSHDILSVGPAKQFLQQLGFIPASRDNAAHALASDAAVMVFPGGDFDAMRPTLAQNVIDFNGRTGYIRTAIEAGVPIVPIVSIGGQETQFFFTRGTWLAKRLGFIKRLTRSEMVPVSAGFPFGVTVGGMNLPLPTRSSRRSYPQSTLRRGSGMSPTWPRSTPTFARSCKRPSTDSPGSAASPYSGSGQPVAAASGRVSPVDVRSVESPAAVRISMNASIIASVASWGSSRVRSSVSTVMASWST